MGKYSKEDYEFEKNKQAILALAKEQNYIKKQHPSVWDYELDQFRRQKKVDRFLILGGLCGLISLMISVFLFLNTMYHWVG
ncbi:MAG: hypothetical protein JXR88_17080 [Clostridia bacterium]|nr:hypothetical protein [Clostridia bacterium]